MSLSSQASSVLRQLDLPLEVSIKFEDFDIKDFKVQNYLVKSDPYLISNDGKIKIFLRFPFYIQSKDNAAIITNEENFKYFGDMSKIIIQSIAITDIQVLEIKCMDATFLAFPGISYGWGIYKENELIIQHSGIDEGIEF